MTDLQRCANCGKPIRPTTTWYLHDWVHDATNRPGCEGLSAHPERTRKQPTEDAS